jgi:cysteine desulfurase
MRTYLDWNATTPPLAEVVDAMARAAREAWGNPASVHADGRLARSRVEDARAAVAELAGADVRDVVLTSGGTEANNLAVRSAFAERDDAGNVERVLVTSRLEHPSVVRVAEELEREKRARVRWLRVKEDATIDLEDLDRALADGAVVLVTVQAVNHETGAIQPVNDVVARAHAKGASVHVDAIQAWGKVANVGADADSRSLAAHKFRGPKGIGALVTRPGLKLHPVLVGGAQERGIRPGTVDPVAAAGLGVAARHAKISPAKYAALAALRDRLERAIGGVVNGATSTRAPHVTNVSFLGWSGPELVAALDLEGISVTSGSACSAGTLEPSPVIRAIAGDARAASAIRISMGDETTTADVDAAIAGFERVLRRS